MNKKDISDFLEKTLKNSYLEIYNVKKEVSIKGSRDFLTNCDLLIEKYIINEMKIKYPNIEILSEEFNFDKEKTEAYFVIDPIDGTINFASGLDIWGIQAAYVENNEAIASCIYFPKLNMIFKSLKDGGAYLNNEKIKIKPNEPISNSLVAFDFSRANEKNYILYKEVSKKVMRVREFGAGSYGFAMLANGSIDAYCILQNTPWDIEPGLLACKEAGAKIYRDNFCTIVSNSDELIKLILESIKTAFGEVYKY